MGLLSSGLDTPGALTPFTCGSFTVCSLPSYHCSLFPPNKIKFWILACPSPSKRTVLRLATVLQMSFDRCRDNQILLAFLVDTVFLLTRPRIVLLKKKVIALYCWLIFWMWLSNTAHHFHFLSVLSHVRPVLWKKSKWEKYSHILIELNFADFGLCPRLYSESYSVL